MRRRKLGVIFMRFLNCGSIDWNPSVGGNCGPDYCEVQQSPKLNKAEEEKLKQYVSTMQLDAKYSVKGKTEKELIDMVKSNSGLRIAFRNAKNMEIFAVELKNYVIGANAAGE